MNDSPGRDGDDASGRPVASPTGPLGLADLIALFTDIRPELLRTLQRRTGNTEAAADLVQDLFLKLASVTAALPDRDQARAYIFRMAINLATDRARIDGRRTELLMGLEVLFEDAAPDPESAAVTQDQMRRVERALAELPAKCREVLILSRMLGLSHREISLKLDVSISLVEKYQLRALRHCRDRLGGGFRQ
ncbi:MAG: sigma-70 family RNA polymerase sigma factor [Sphingomonas sp.]